MLILCSLCSKPASFFCIHCEDPLCDEHKIAHETMYPDPSINGDTPAEFIEISQPKSIPSQDQKENK